MRDFNPKSRENQSIKKGKGAETKTGSGNDSGAESRPEEFEDQTGKVNGDRNSAQGLVS